MIKSNNSEYKNLLSTSVQLFDEEIYLKEIQSYELDANSVSTVRGSLTLQIKKSLNKHKIHLDSLNINFRGFHNDELINNHDNTFIWDLNQLNTQEDSSGTYHYPFQFVIDSKFPESIQTLVDKIDYFIIGEINFHNTKKFKEQQLVNRIPVKLIKSLYSPLILNDHTSQIITEGYYKNYFKYSVAMSNKYVYLNDDLYLDVEIKPLNRLFLKNQLFKIKSFKLYLIQSYNPRVSFTSSINIQRKKYLLLEYCIDHRKDFNCSTKSFNFKLKVDFRNLHEKHTEIYPSFVNNNRIVDFNISHYIRSMFTFEEKKFDNDDFLNKIPVDNSMDEESPIIDNPDEQLFQIILNTHNHKLRITELLFKNPITLLSAGSKRANIPPPTYSDLMATSCSMLSTNSSSSSMSLISLDSSSTKTRASSISKVDQKLNHDNSSVSTIDSSLSKNSTFSDPNSCLMMLEDSFKIVSTNQQVSILPGYNDILTAA